MKQVRKLGLATTLSAKVISCAYCVLFRLANSWINANLLTTITPCAECCLLQLLEGRLTVVQDLELKNHKTKELAKLLEGDAYT